MRYTEKAEKVIQYAKKISQKLKHNYVGTEHLLLGLLHVEDTVANKVLTDSKVYESDVQRLIKDLITPERGGAAIMDRSGYTPKLELVLENAMDEAEFTKTEAIGTEHLLIALIRTPDCAGSRLLNSMELSPQKLFADIVAAMGRDGEAYREEMSGRGGGRGTGNKTLKQYSRDLTELAAEGKLDPCIGRESEIERVIQILSRRGKNNPCLLGEPGVGKTAIVEGLAQRIESGMVPDSVKGKKVLSLDLSGMVAGSKYRGEFEERIKKVMNEVIADGNVLLFIDEMHTLIGAGGAEGALDASNILKPALSRGEIQVIGATTINEYRKHVEKDAALERRFQPVMVDQPSTEETKDILNGIKDRYEKHHGITISEEAVDACVSLSERYIQDRFLPDKAIDLMDEASARLRLMSVKVPEKLYETEQKLHECDTDFEKALMEGRLSDAARIRNDKEEYEHEIAVLKSRYERRKKNKELNLSFEDIADVVSLWTKIPVSRLSESEATRLKSLEKTLHKRVIGQEEAISALSRAVRRGRVGLKEPGRPIGSFLFLGPTGVGKTEISKALAEAVFGSEDNMIRVDMTEYMEKYSVSKMIGSPPGYVGYDEGGQLSEKVRRNPYSVILFDEIEKAHPDVFNVLLQVLDDGHITDSQGRKVDFKNTIIIMTSNAGAKAIIEPKRLGFSEATDEKADYEDMKSGVMDEVKRIFKPEFLNRIDETIVFRQLNKDDMSKIVTIMTKSLVDRLKSEMQINLTISAQVKKYIVDKSYEPKYGARPLRRQIQTDMEDVLAEEILNGNVKPGEEITAKLKDKKIVFENKKTGGKKNGSSKRAVTRGRK
ncbi:MAG: ATP-dependent Clp protease ATP-binding subunit [Lachnospiraceae bacterium]|nr:ATP-dependent Clp protease ATP-binding subunit [Lachnospiraceae bacterium]